MSEANKNVQFAINIPFGQISRKTANEIEMQGSVLGPIKASIQIDKVGKQCIEENENLYRYKKLVDIPPLAFVDNIIGFSKCGLSSIKLNAFLNTKIQTRRLWYGEKKCHQIHAGENNIFCPTLNVHENVMEKVNSDKYLGDVISSDCKNNMNIDKKVAKGMGIVAQIMALLSEVSLGSHYHEIDLILRESLFINGIFTNLEVSYGLTKQQIERMEEVDKILLRKILKAHSKTPIESLFLETGTLPLSYIIKYRRLMYLHHILTRNQNSLIFETFNAQDKFPAKDDWVLTIKDDLKYFDINLSYEQIRKLSKYSFKKYLKKIIKAKVLKDLNEVKKEHTKMKNLTYVKLQTQPYLLSNNFFPETANFLFRARTRMLDVKNNFKNSFDDDIHLCPICESDEDTQEHLIKCEMMNNEINVDVNYIIIIIITISIQNR